MELKYVGPKPIISHTGIEFDKNKEDKYIYLNIIVQFLKALSHEYHEDKTYIYDAQLTTCNACEILNELKRYCPKINILMDKQNHKIEDIIDHNLQRAHENNVLSAIDKEVLENNIHIMHDYLVQRSINKSVYYCAVDMLAELLKKDHIDHIIVPMYQEFAHVLHSVQGSITRQKIPIDTKLDIYNDNGKLLLKLQVVRII
ncbi:hypothetical protein KKG72_04410 [bacterium]|nr:hypothetical protein [bacterium]MBU1994319.1 hypothetical protein [bacterium]